MIDEEKYLSTFFGRQADYYLRKYKAHYEGDRFTFNIGPFLAGLFWFLYRKLYREFMVIVAALVLLTILEEAFYEVVGTGATQQRIIYLISTIAFASLYGFIGNYLYIKRSDKRIKKVLAKTEDEAQRIKLLSKGGGVSWAPYIVLALLILLLFVLNNLES